MDKEMWTLLITVASTLTAALGGTYISNKRAEKLQNQRLQAERAEWAREKKLAAYEQFWNAQWEAFNACHRLERGEERVDQLLQLVSEARPTILRVIAPKSVADLAEEIHKRLMWFCGTLYPDTTHEVHVAKYIGVFGGLMKQFEEAMRADLDPAHPQRS